MIRVGEKEVISGGDSKELSLMGLSGDCTEPRQKAGFIYMCESFEALTKHLTISDTTSAQTISKKQNTRTRVEQSVWVGNHCPDPIGYFIFISEAR